ncbi:MAG: prepilin-type N-terminal cleavage/methylation domain-containing protein [Planctomycetaceae bacterium]
MGSALRRGFTLLEMLLVLAVLVLIAAIAWPSMQNIYRDLQLKESVGEVRTELASTRLHAVESGLAYQFRYEPDGRRYVVVPFEREPQPSAAGGGSTTMSSPGQPLPHVAGELPEGLRFRAAVSGLSATEQMIARGQQVSEPVAVEWLAGLPNAAELAGVQWSPPIVFYPDGTADDAAFEVVDEKRQLMVIAVRGLTGSVSTSDVTQERLR